MSIQGGITVAELAAFLGGTLTGDGARVIESCCGLSEATPRHASLFHVVKYAKELETTRAGVVILPPGDAKNVRRAEGLEPLTTIECKNTYYAWQQTLVRLLGHRQHPTVGISPMASIHPSAKIGKGVNIHPFAVIGENVTVGDRANIFPHVTLLCDVSIGEDTTLYPSVTVYERCRIGNRCLINAGTSIGNDGSAYAHNAGVHHKVPQNGIVVIEDDVEIMANTIVERAVLDATVIGRGSKIGSCCVIGHNCQIGMGAMIIGGVCIAGSTRIGKYVVIGGQAGVNGHLDVPDGVRIAAQSGLISNPEPGSEMFGTPAMEAGHAKRCYALFMNLPDIMSRLRDVEKKTRKLVPNQEAGK